MVHTWDDAPDDVIVVCPKNGGIFMDINNILTAWSGSDPDKEILCYSYNESTKNGKFQMNYLLHMEARRKLKVPFTLVSFILKE